MFHTEDTHTHTHKLGAIVQN